MDSRDPSCYRDRATAVQVRAPLLMCWLPVRGAVARDGPVAGIYSRLVDQWRRITVSRQPVRTL
jgi:hypothetical protein